MMEKKKGGKTMQENVCNKCKHQWLPRVDKTVKCPRCGSYKWNDGETIRKGLEKLYKPKVELRNKKG